MWEIAIDTLARVAKVWELAIDTPARVAIGKQAIHHGPRAFARAPTAANPCRDAPHPPCSQLDVTPAWVTHEARREVRAGVDQVDVPRVEVRLVYGPVDQPLKFGVIHGKRAPEVCHEAIEVVHGLDAGYMRPTKKHGKRAGEWLDIVAAIAEPRPYHRRRPGLATEPGERGFKCHA